MVPMAPAALMSCTRPVFLKAVLQVLTPRPLTDVLLPKVGQTWEEKLKTKNRWGID